MTVRSTTLKRQAHEVQWLTALYDMWPVQEEQDNVNYQRIAEQLGAGAAPFLKASSTYREIGALITRLVYNQGRRSFWTLALPKDEALQRLAAFHHTENTTEKSKPVSEPETQLVASVGDDDTDSPFEPLKDIRKDEQEALVAAARQYAGRKQILVDTIAQLKAAGIETNSKAFTFTNDPVLEAVVLVLPVIDRYKRQIEYLETRIETFKNQIAPLQHDLAEARTENKGLRRIVDRITNDSVTETARVSSSR